MGAPDYDPAEPAPQKYGFFTCGAGTAYAKPDSCYFICPVYLAWRGDGGRKHERFICDAVAYTPVQAAVKAAALAQFLAVALNQGLEQSRDGELHHDLRVLAEVFDLPATRG